MKHARPPCLLIVEDQEVDFVLLRGICEHRFAHSEINQVDNLEDLRRELARGIYDLVITDYHLPTMSGSDTLRVVSEMTPHVPVIVVSGVVGEETAVKFMRDGARDYIVKSQLARLPEAIARELRHREERRELEDFQKASLLNEKLASVGRLAGVMAHEMSTPLSIVMANIEAMTELIAAPEATKLQATLTRPLAEARRGANRMLGIVRNMKCYLHPGRAEKNPTLPVRRILENAKWAAASVVDSRSRVMIEASDSLLLAVDEGKLVQVFVNLLSNAAQAQSPDRLATNRIDVHAWQDGNLLRVTVSDNGHGIEQANLGKLFEYGFTTKPTGEGMGFGLALSREILAEMNGTIDVRSVRGEGTTFEITLPAAEPAREAMVEAEPTLARKVVPAHLQYHVLIVDDDEGMLDLLEQMLNGFMRVERATNVAEARRKLAAGLAVDLILSDWELGDDCGGTIYEDLEKASSPLRNRMIFMTGGVYSKDAREFFQKFDGRRVIDKPFNLQILLRVIQHVQTNS